MRREDWIFMSAFIVALIMIFVLQSKTSERLDEVQVLHCQMVALWAESNGERGWPDYNETAQYCPALETEAVLP